MSAASEWLNEQFKKWSDAVGAEMNTSAFARYLGVPQPSLTRWLNGGPIRGDNILKLALKLGPEIYDVLGEKRPPNFSDSKSTYDRDREFLDYLLSVLSLQHREQLLNFGRFLSEQENSASENKDNPARSRP